MRKLYWIINCKIRFLGKEKKRREGKVRTEREKVDGKMGTNRSLKKKNHFFNVNLSQLDLD